MSRRYKRRRQAQRLPEQSFAAQISTLTHDGRGLAYIDGKAVFIRDALPKETIQFKYTARHSQYDEACVQEIISPAAERVEPRCPHFGLCGGCALQHLHPDHQIEHKQNGLLENLSRIGRVTPEHILPAITGPHWGYRHKARLAVKYVAKKNRVLVGFRERGNPFVADLARCEILHPKVGALLLDLANLIHSLSIYQRVPQIEVAVADDAVALVFRVLDPPTEDDKCILRNFAQQHTLQIYLQPKGLDSTYLLWPDQARLYYRLPDYGLELEFLPHHFTQVNAKLNQLMIKHVLELLDPRPEDEILDLFCGLGNFTLPLARYARSVSGVEGEQSLVDWASRNAELNGIGNVRYFCADLSQEAVQQSWMEHHYRKVLLDPPRSGAKAILGHIAALAPQRLVYVSCHPATLARDAGELVHQYGFRLLSAGVMDMFPHTTHIESVALFERQERI